MTANFRRDGFSGLQRVVNGLTFQVYLLLGHLSQEDFMQNVIPGLSFLKLRGSYGLTGNQSIEAYATFGNGRLRLYLV